MRQLFSTLWQSTFLLCCLAVPALAQPGAATEPEGAIALAHDERLDATIAARLGAMLAELDDYGDVEVAVKAGIVTLTGTTRDSGSLARLARLVARMEGVAAINNRVVTSSGLADRLLPSYERFLVRAQKTLAMLPLFTVAIAGLLAIYLLGRLVAALPVWPRVAPNAFIGNIYRQVLRLVFLLAGLVVALDVLDATALLGSILGAAGVIGLALGFAVRDTVENFIASIMLSIRQPFRPFDMVEIQGDVGKVVRLTSRATIMLSVDGNMIRVPNATVFKSRIVNFSRNPERRFAFAIDIDPTVDMGAVRDRAQERLAALPFVLQDPACAVWIDEKDGSDIELRFAAWIDQSRTNFDMARGEAIRLLRAMLQEEGALRPPPLSRVYQVTASDPAMAPNRAAPNDLTDASIGDLSTTDGAALERLARTELAEAETRDLLARPARRE